MKTIFINPQEQRLRAGWRLLLQLVAFLLITFLVQIPLGILLAALPNLTSGSNLWLQFLLRPLTGLISLAAMGFSYWLAARFFDRRPVRDFGFHFSPRWWSDFGFGLFLGAFLMALVFAVEYALGWVTITAVRYHAYTGIPFGLGLAASLLFYICVGFYEEMLSRGYHLRNLAEGFNFGRRSPKTAIFLAYVLSSSIFGLLHLFNPNTSLISTFNLILAGIFLGFAYVLTGELAIPIGLHITWNFFQGSVFGFPVSGGTPSVAWLALRQGGPDLWTGAAFGPEAGLLGLLAMFLGILLTAGWLRLRGQPLAVQTRLAEYPSPATSMPKRDEFEENLGNINHLT
ncbi:CPBP family intramembrane glutamic endopeptidase [Levilinea saccharolytica]|uniref:CPBP family intramembrane glutamic endopeptidase n=1 Tax=Levilinea saccharolytica TaxID=229921 RepID=UPI0009462745|nr:type II CAAX endopeptidase family protein [Levilinea saccharolytica]GAP16555.1 CAAX protease self-immunity [Levilinea saccharolytica]